MKTDLIFKDKLPSESEIKRRTKTENIIVLFDERLLIKTEFSIWVKSFKNRMALSAGEKLKDLNSWPRYVEQLLPMLEGYARNESIILAVGGGTVGDFSGFMASVLKRGVGFAQMPSTWLAAVDSAYGGKTGLNVGEYKNQVGTFYEPLAVFCVRELLENQSEENFASAMGEVLKMAMLMGGELHSKLVNASEFTEKHLWKALPKIIAAKYSFVKRDPLETKGVRQFLNLGHTLAHVLELEHKLPHGIAVQYGLKFAIDWSFKREILNSASYAQMTELLRKHGRGNLCVTPREVLRRRLLQDKKAIGGDRINFVFVKKAGKPLLDKVPVDDIVSAAQNLGWAT